jgi:Holliday junction resolvasome RuvABC endonuclease subunit
MNTILSLYPNARGLGYACIEIPERVVDFGVLRVRRFRNRRIMRFVEQFVEFYRPTVVVVRSSDERNIRSERIGELIGQIEASVRNRGIPVHEYSREQVREVFEVFGATNKDQVVQKVCEMLPVLTPFAPSARRLWDSEDDQMGIFDAVALAVTHQYLTE